VEAAVEERSIKDMESVKSEEKGESEMSDYEF